MTSNSRPPISHSSSAPHPLLVRPANLGAGGGQVKLALESSPTPQTRNPAVARTHAGSGCEGGAPPDPIAAAADGLLNRGGRGEYAGNAGTPRLPPRTLRLPYVPRG